MFNTFYHIHTTTTFSMWETGSEMNHVPLLYHNIIADNLRIDELLQISVSGNFES